MKELWKTQSQWESHRIESPTLTCLGASREHSVLSAKWKLSLVVQPQLAVFSTTLVCRNPSEKALRAADKAKKKKKKDREDKQSKKRKQSEENGTAPSQGAETTAEKKIKSRKNLVEVASYVARIEQGDACHAHSSSSSFTAGAHLTVFAQGGHI